MNRIWIGLFILLLPINSMLAAPNTAGQPGLRLVLPINEPKKIVLSIQLPSNFRATQSFKNQNLNNKELFFIPVDRIKSKQKETILLIPKLNSSLSAVELVEKFTAQFKKTTEKMMVLKEQKKEHNGFVHTAKLIMYEYKNEIEIVNLYAVSGPKHLVMLQYSIKIQNKSQIQPAVNKMVMFFNQNVKIKKQAITAPQIRLKDSI